MNRSAADGSDARLANAVMPVADRLRMYAQSPVGSGWMITGVSPHRRGVVIELKLPGYTYNPPRRLLLIGLAQVVEVPDRWTRGDDDQVQADIGDDMYERARYDEHDGDIEPGRQPTRSEEPR